LRIILRFNPCGSITIPGDTKDGDFISNTLPKTCRARYYWRAGCQPRTL
jgi:hypothetical protein